MNVIGKKSASSVINTILLVVFVLLSIITLFSIAVMLLVSMDILSFSSTSMELRLEFGALAFRMPGDTEIGLQLVAALFCLGLIILYVIHHLRKIFKNFTLEKVFIIENTSSLRHIGVSLIAMAFVFSAYNFAAASIIHDLLMEKGIEVVINFNPNITMIISGVIILIFAEIFRIAVKIAQESELTI